MNSAVDTYITSSRRWPAEMTMLRPILLDCGLDEEINWGKPCFGRKGKNIVIFQEMKDSLCLMFFKGALLSDPEGVLEVQGPNSRSARRMRFTSRADVARLTSTVRAYAKEAIAVEEAGLEVGPRAELVLVAELQQRLDQDAELRDAFGSLTPGRQREYNIYFSNAKQAKTRAARVERYAQQILDGRGFRDR
jgi:uncharacterized protein YdeI (YjbR/CyaY-like superfamily)